MNKKSYVTHGLFLAVVGVALFQLVLFRKVQDLERKLDREARPERRQAETLSPPAAVTPNVEPERVPPPPPAPVTRATPKPPANLEKMVRQIVREERAKVPEITWVESPWKDPMTVMKEELKLSPSQEARIRELRKARTEWYRELGRRYKEDSNPVGDEYGRAKTDYQQAYRDSLFRELDLRQQERYEELIESGLLSEWGRPKTITITGGSAVLDREEK